MAVHKDYFASYDEKQKEERAQAADFHTSIGAIFYNVVRWNLTEPDAWSTAVKGGLEEVLEGLGELQKVYAKRRKKV